MKQGNTPPDKPIGGMARSLARKATVAAAALAMFAPFVVSGTAAYAAPSDPVYVTVNGSDVAAAADNQNGLTFKGFGVLSANSTSALLMDYKSENPDAYWKMIDVLFGGDNPIMNTVKIEMGNDRNNSTGPNAATMRTSDEYPDVAREPGFQLAADAMKVNPNVRVSILRWNTPTWVKNNDDVYKWYKNTILAVYRQYGYMVDSVNPHINENAPNLNWTKDFSNRVKTDKDGFIGAGSITDLDGNPVPDWSSETEKELFHKIRTVISDEVSTGSFGDDMLSDKALRDAVDIAGYHYNTADQGNNFKTLADQYDKEIWNSEAQSTFSVGADRPNNTMNTGSGEGDGGNNGQYDGTSGTGIGGINSPLEMANTFVRGFVASRRTNFIYQPAIGSFYDGFQYSSKELLSARDPWSGWIQYDTGMSVLEHVSNFAKTGYETDSADKDANGIWRGIPGASKSDISDGNPPGRGTASNTSRGGATSYMTLAAPDKSNFSTVIVNDSKYVKTYRIKANDMALTTDTMELWETKGPGTTGTYASNYMKPVQETKVDAEGYYTFTVDPWSIATATTLDKATNVNGTLTAKDGEGSRVPVSQEYTEGKDQAVLDVRADKSKNGELWADDFEYQGKTVQSYDPKTKSMVTEDFVESRGGDTGATPLYTNDTNGAFEVYKTDDGNRVMRQQIGAGLNGGAWNNFEPITTIGDVRWANYKASTDVRFEQGGYATIAARQQTDDGWGRAAAEIQVDPNGNWEFHRFRSTVASGKASDTPGVNWKAGSGQWNNIAVQVAGNVYTAYLNGVKVAEYTDSAPQANGRVQLRTGFTNVQFDNLKVETVDGYTPYYTDFIDNMHMRNWSDVSTPVLQYDGQWQHLNGQGMKVYKRSISNSTGKGATMTYTFNGTGLDIAGANNGNAKLNVTVDGKQIVLNGATWGSAEASTTYMLRGLSNGQHTVAISTADGNGIAIDVVGVVKATSDGTPDTAPLKAAIDSTADLKEAEWNPDTWKVLANNLADANAALVDPAGYGLDAEGMNAIIARIAAAREGLVDVSISSEILNLGYISAAAVKTDASTLPAKITVKDTEVKVTWDKTAASKLASATDYGKVTVSGITDDKAADGYRYRVTAEVTVIPANTKYFIDSGTDGKDSPEYTAVKTLLGSSLLNDKVDQTSDGTTWGYDANGMKLKGGRDINDKQSTGLYSDTDNVVYYLPLKAGVYRLTAGFQEWWGSDNRESSQTVYASDGKTVLATGDNLKLSKSNTNLTGVVDFTVPTDQTVKYVVSKAGKDRPVISWVAVAENLDYGFVGALVKSGTLPQSITVGGTAIDVASWDADAADKINAAAVYDKVTVSGKTAADKAFTAEFEVLPEGLQYFIDSGTNGTDSPEYTAAKAVVPTLRNNKVDQTSDGSTWGYNADGQTTYDGGNINDKFSTGLWAGKGKSTIYYLPLPVGTYTISAGFHEWWNVSRNMKVYVLDGEGKELSNGNADISGTMNFTSTHNITLTTPQTVTLKVDGVSADPVISWVAVAGTVDESYVDKTALNKAIAAASALAEINYTPESWAVLKTALDEANAVAKDDKATNDQVSIATTKLNDAIDALIEVQATDLGVIAAVSGKDLPTSVAGKTVTWSADAAAAFKAAAPYTTVKVSGAADNAPVTATVEVIPDGLQYFIDSGTNGVDSPEYTAVKNAVTGLLNDKVDQTSDGSAWGYDATAMKVKGGNMDINDKQATGIYSDDDDLTYYLPLKAGTYTLNAGFREWWGMGNRESAQTVYAEDGTTVLATGDNLKLGKNNPDLTGTVTFTLDKDQTVRYVVSKGSTAGDAQKPVISWLAVAKQADVVAKHTVTFDANGGTLAGDATATVEDGKTVAKPADPTYDGYDFTGWTTDKEGKNAYDFNAPVTGDLTLYAQWKAKEVTPPVDKVDKNALQAKVNEVTADMGNLKADDYTYTSWDNLSKQLDAAKTVLADVSATQEQVDAALKSLTDARAGLVQRPSSGGGTTIITKKQATIAGVTAADAWFDGQSHAGFAGTPSSEFKGSYEVTYTGAGTTTYGPSKTAPTAAGTYRVTISVPSSDSTWYGSLALEFAIRSGSTVVNRFYSAGSNRHMWTASAAESGALPGMGWNAEGAGFTMDAHAGVPVYRLYDPAGNQHLWTTSTAERDHLLGVGWNDEGIAFYENPTAKIDVYRLYDPYTGEHLWTTSLLERDSLVASGQWTYEGIAFKALS